MDPKDLKDEEDINSVTIDDDEKVDIEEEEKDPPAGDKADIEDEDLEDEEEEEDQDVDEEDNSYRPSDDEPEEKKVPETVPLKKYLALKTKFKEAKSDNSSELTDKSLATFAEESGLNLDTVKGLAKIISAQATQEATKAAEERVKPIVLEKMNVANAQAFNNDFKKNIVAKYPELAGKAETFKKIAFSKDFLHLKTLEDIKKEFFPNVVAKAKAGKKVKTSTIEPGSKGGAKKSEKVSFSTLHDHPDKYAKVMKDPTARAKYYAWQEANED